MFDATTTELIRSAPALSGVSAEALPQDLTRIYAELVTLRLKATEADAELLERLKRLKRISDIYEAYVDVSEQSHSRRAAAFVSATAQQMLGSAITSIYGTQPLLLTSGWIHPWIASPLLFLIAGQNADAREAARLIQQHNIDDLLQSALVESIYDLATENFIEVLNRGQRLSHVHPNYDAIFNDLGSQSLYGLCWAGLMQLVSQVFSREMPPTTFEIDDSSTSTFDRVVALSTSEVVLTSPVPETHIVSSFSGPRHLAKLLRKVSEVLDGAGIAQVIAPGGTDPVFWQKWLHHRSIDKPLLWPSHRNALDTGMLEKGQSTVLVLPTGAGKTTLSELKIAATLARKEKVVFLAPTLALVDQLKDDLGNCFPSSLSSVTISADGDLAALMPAANLQDIEVMTPERCLALLSHNKDALEGVGLVVFDECHLLSPQGGGTRSLDAMLCLLQITKRAKEADLLLLSAMLTNPEPFAAWIESITKRPCPYFQDLWKPSRQARGVVLYRQDELKLNAGLFRPYPYALFALHQNWNAEAATDTRLIKLAEETVSLEQNDDGYPRPTSNGVAAFLAVRAAAAGLKTIVFVQQAAHAPSTAKKIAPKVKDASVLSPSEVRLWEEVQAELGGPQFSLVDPGLGALPHNGDMLAQERRLVESVFRRDTGATVIVATPTLAQGMNLPAQLAILAGTKRHDDDGRQPLEAHEILNAAGRAGRAGHLANGLVLMIPEPVATLAYNGKPRPNAIAQLQLLQPASDRCVEIQDPLMPVLDRIQAGQPNDVQALYVLGRLRAGELPEDATAEAISLVRRSFSAFRAKQRNAEAEFEAKLSALQSVLETEESDTEIVTIAAANGLPPSLLIAARKRLQATPETIPQDIPSWSDWLIDFLGSDATLLEQGLSRDVGVAAYVSRGKKKGGPPNDQERARLKAGLRAWLSGKSFAEIEEALGVSNKKLGKCPRARDLVLKLANRSLYILATAIAEIARTIGTDNSSDIKNLASLETFGFALRRGFDSPEKVALAILRPSVRSRVQIHQQYAELLGASPIDEGGDFAAVVSRINIRITMEAFAKAFAPPHSA